MESSQNPLKQVVGQSVENTNYTTIPTVKTLKYFCAPTGKELTFLIPSPPNTPLHMFA